MGTLMAQFTYIGYEAYVPCTRASCTEPGLTCRARDAEHHGNSGWAHACQRKQRLGSRVPAASWQHVVSVLQSCERRPD